MIDYSQSLGQAFQNIGGARPLPPNNLSPEALDASSALRDAFQHIGQPSQNKPDISQFGSQAGALGLGATVGGPGLLALLTALAAAPALYGINRGMNQTFGSGLLPNIMQGLHNPLQNFHNGAQFVGQNILSQNAMSQALSRNISGATTGGLGSTVARFVNRN